MSDSIYKQIESMLALGNRLGALMALKSRIAENEADTDSMHLLSSILMEDGKHAEAIPFIKKVLAADPAFAPALYNLGVCELSLGDQGSALAQFNRALEVDPGHSGARYNVGFLMRRNGDFEGASQEFEKLVQINPGWVSAWQAHCEVLHALGKFESVVSACDALVRQGRASPAIYRIRADAQRSLNRFGEAEVNYLLCLKQTPGDVDALHNLAGTLQLMERDADAIPLYERAISIASRTSQYADRLGPALSELIKLRRGMCAWPGLAELENVAKASLSQPLSSINPFLALVLTDKPGEQLAAARGAWPIRTKPALRSARTRSGTKLRIGYLSGDFYDHPTAHLLTGVIEAHDPSKFQTIAYSVGPDDQSKYRKRLERAFGVFRHITSRDDAEIARLIEQDDLDLLVDVMCHTRNSRPSILLYRPAPVVAHYLAFPGSLGTKLVDYFIGDHHTIGEGDDVHFDESVVRLPECYQANDDSIRLPAAVPQRSEFGLPESAIVFAAIMQNLKLSPALFDSYMAILNACPNSVLWMIEDRFSVRSTLRNEAAARGVDANRIVFSPRMAHEEHLSRLRLADICLDSWPYGGHTSSSDALFAGVPVVALRGSSFTSRVSSSLLTAVGLPELIAHTVQDFRSLAIELGTSPDKLTGLKKTLSRNLLTHPLFDTKRTARHLELAYEKMIDRSRNGLPPASFAVDALPR